MALLVDYKEFLVEGNVFGRSDIRKDKWILDMDAGSVKWVDILTEVASIYEKIDELIGALVSGVIDHEEYEAKKLSLLMGGDKDAIVAASPDGNVTIRPHITALLTIVNTVNITAIEPVSIFITTLHFDSGYWVQVHEPAMEVMWKVRTTMANIIAQQQQHQQRPAIAIPNVAFQPRG